MLHDVATTHCPCFPHLVVPCGIVRLVDARHCALPFEWGCTMKRLRDRLASGSVGRSAVDQMASLLKNAAEDTRSPTYGEFWRRVWGASTLSSETPLFNFRVGTSFSATAFDIRSHLTIYISYKPISTLCNSGHPTCIALCVQWRL